MEGELVVLFFTLLSYDGQSLSMKKCWENTKNDCTTLGYGVSQIPSYESIRKRVNGYKVKTDE